MVPDELFRQRSGNYAEGLLPRQFLLREETQVEKTLRKSDDHKGPQLIQRDFDLFVILVNGFSDVEKLK